MLIKIVAVQSKLGDVLPIEEKLYIFKQKPDFVCLPEYCFIDKTMPDFSRAALQSKEFLETLRAFSEALSTVLIGGSIVEADDDSLYNSAYLFVRGKKVGKYRKLNPVAGEIDKGILPGDKLFMARVDGVKIAIMICADALNINLFESLKKEDVDIVFIPTTSPLRPNEKKIEKHKRDNDIYLRGARIAGSFVVKTCGVGSLFGKTLQGRSLIVAPWGFLKRVDIYSENSKCILTSVLDIDEIREFRSKKKIAELVNNKPTAIDSQQ